MTDSKRNVAGEFGEPLEKVISHRPAFDVVDSFVEQATGPIEAAFEIVGVTVPKFKRPQESQLRLVHIEELVATVRIFVRDETLAKRRPGPVIDCVGMGDML